jgi:hypothetical protein
MGFLVQDEAFDEWTGTKEKWHNSSQRAEKALTKGYADHFEEWCEADVKAMVLRDRNHPSIIMWSIGNEIEWTYPRYREASGYWEEDDVDYHHDLPPYDAPTMKEKFESIDPGEHELAPIAKNLSTWIKELDTTRPVTANLVLPCVGHLTGFTDALDIIGYSYRRAIYDYGHERYPDKMIFGSENWGQWHEWQACIEREFIPGLFLWTGINYLGESRAWPNKGSNSGLLDLAGFKIPRFHMFRSLWVEEPAIYVATSKQDDASPYEQLEDGQIVYKNRDEKWMPMWHWQAVNEHWNYYSGDAVFVEVYTNCDAVELFHNDRSLGVKKLGDFDDHIIKWLVPYAAGKITAVGLTGGKPVTYELSTAQSPAVVCLTTDKDILAADSYDVAHLTVQLCDTNGIPVRADEREVVFDIEGHCRLLGVDNGWVHSVQDYKSNRCKTYQGRCLLIVQSTEQPGEATITASADGLKSQQVRLRIGEQTN